VQTRLPEGDDLTMLPRGTAGYLPRLGAMRIRHRFQIRSSTARLTVSAFAPLSRRQIVDVAPSATACDGSRALTSV